MKNKTTFIYSLSDPITGKIRYIGKSNRPSNRLYHHIYRIKENSDHKSCWIKGLLRKGVLPKMDIVDEVDNSEWEFWEQHYISLFKSWGFDLVNMTRGGDGVTETSEEIKNKISIGNTGKVMTDESRKKQSDTHKRIRTGDKLQDWCKLNGYPMVGKTHSKESRKKISDGNKGKTMSAEARVKISNSSKGRKCSEETKEKLRVALTGKKHNISDESRRRMIESKLGKRLSESHKLKISLSNKGKKRTEESKALMRKNHIGMRGKHTSQETKDKISLALKGRKVSDETKLKLSISKRGKSTWNKGGKMSEEWKKKISASNKGKSRTEETKKKLKDAWVKRRKRRLDNYTN